MGKFIAVIFALCLISSCNQEPAYRIQGIVPGTPDGTEAILYGQNNIQDTVIIKQGRFLFQGKVDEPGLFEIWIDLSPEIVDDYKKDIRIITLFVENSDIRFECESIDCLPLYASAYHNVKGKVTVTGPPSSNLYQAYQQENVMLIAQLNQVIYEYTKEYENPSIEKRIFNTQKGIKLAEQENQLRKQIQENQLRFIRKNLSSPVSLVIFSNLINNAKLTKAKMDGLLQSFDKSLWGMAKYAEVKAEVNKLYPVAIGEKYTDLELVDQQGTTVRLSDYVKPGQYNMVEFWASWCGGCRGEIPHLKHVHKTYGQDVLNMVSVSLDDEDIAWKKALSEEGMSWTQLRDPQGWKGEFITKYHILGIPFSLILDPDGRIVDRNVVGGALDIALTAHIGEKLNK